ncbi:hypothetical protein ACWDKQ_33295 [Saccharopolyspora sp. NPDC000995]
MLRTALREAASWPVRNGRPVVIAVNLVDLLPHDPEFVDEITAIITESGGRDFVPALLPGGGPFGLEVVQDHAPLEDHRQQRRVDRVAQVVGGPALLGGDPQIQ